MRLAPALALLVLPLLAAPRATAQDITEVGDHYVLQFDEQNGELTILDGSRAVVTTTVKEEALAKKAPATSFEVKTGDNGPMLTKITFGGSRYALLISDNQSAEGQ